MSPPAKITVGCAALIAAAALVAVVALRHPATRSAFPQSSPYRGSIPPPGIRAPDFTLHDYRGGLASIRKLRGKVVLLSFVDTKCKDKCPIVASVMASAMRQLARNERNAVVFLLMSVDPRLDTARSIRGFLGRRHALSLGYLVGSVEQMRPVWKAYGVLPAVDTGNANVHSSDVRIFDRRGVWVSTQHAGVDLTAVNLVHDARLALRP